MTGAVEALSLFWLFGFFVVAAAGVWAAGLRLTLQKCAENEA